MTLTEALPTADTRHVADHPDIGGIWVGVREHGPGRWLAVSGADWLDTPLALVNHQGEFLVWDTPEQAAAAALVRGFGVWPKEPLCEERMVGWGTCWTDWQPKEVA